MHDPGLVRRLQTDGDLHRHPAFALEDRRESGAFDERHRDVLDAVDLSEIVNADDVLVRDLARQQQLLLEAPFEVSRRVGIARGFRPDHLQRDGDAEAFVPRLIHGAHSADSEQLDDVIAVSERLPDSKRAAAAGGCRRRVRQNGSRLGTDVRLVGANHFPGASGRLTLLRDRHYAVVNAV